MCGDVVRLGSQRLPVPVLSLGQLVQPDVGLSCGGKTESGQGSSGKVKTWQLWVSTTAGMGNFGNFAHVLLSLLRLLERLIASKQAKIILCFLKKGGAVGWLTEK